MGKLSLNNLMSGGSYIHSQCNTAYLSKATGMELWHAFFVLLQFASEWGFISYDWNAYVGPELCIYLFEPPASAIGLSVV